MIRIDNTENASPDNKKLHLPFEELIKLLRNEGFLIKPDDYIEMLKVVETYAEEGLLALKYRLAPLIATSEAEQQKFYRIFDKYAKTSKEQDIKQYKRVWKRRMIIGIAIVVLLIGAVWVLSNLKPSTHVLATPPPDFNLLVNGEGNVGPGLAAIGDTITLDASPVFFDGKSYDTSGLEIAWDLGKGWEHAGQRKISYIPNETGNKTFRLKLSSHKNDTVATTDILVCDGVLASILANNGEPVYSGDSVLFEPVVRGNGEMLKDAEWIVIINNDSVSGHGQNFRAKFPSAGSYQVTLETSDACAQQSKTLAFEVSDRNNPYRLTSTSSALAVMDNIIVNPLLWWLLLLPVGAGILLYWLHRREKNRLKSGPKKTDEDLKDEKKEKKATPPYEVPFKNRDIDFIEREPEMNLLFRAMRSKTEDECSVLNIRRSIQSEIRSGGMPSLVFTNKMKSQEYLILLDRSYANSQQLKLFEYLVKVLCGEDLNIARFYYRDFSIFHNEDYPAGISFQRLVEIYRGDVLIIFGNAHQLIYSNWPVIEKEKSQLLNEWEFKAILTPVAYRDWGAKEDALKKEVILLPADIQGQVSLLQAIKEKQLKQDKYLASFSEFYEPGNFYFTDVKEIENYLEDPVLFQWLCGVCVYPTLRWEVLVEVGRVICKREGQPYKMNFTNILKLVRIQWMHEGNIPDKTRLELLKRLRVENELVARETILEMLKYPELYLKGSHFFDEEKKQQQITNQFVLYANDKILYKDYEQGFQKFQELWKQNKIFDLPLKRYLDKHEGDNWQTPIKSNDSSPGLEDLFDTTRENSLKQINRRYRLGYGIAALVLLLLGTMLFNKTLLEKMSSDQFMLAFKDTSRTYTIPFKLIPDSCFPNPSVFREGNGSIEVNNKSYDLIFVSNDSAIATLPYSDAISSEGLLKLSWNGDRNSVANRVGLSRIANTLYVSSCSNIEVARTPLLINYFDSTGADSIGLLLKVLSNNYDLRSSPLRIPGKSQIVYYRDSDRQRAEEVGRRVDSLMKKKLKVVYVPARSTADTTLELSISFIAPGVWTPVPLSGLDKNLNEIWKGRANNRLITIDIPDRYIWYSTGRKETYGTYRIIEASRKETVTKIIANAGGQYAVFFLQDITSSGFKLCFSPDFRSSKDQADKMEVADCANSMDQMILFYPGETQRNSENIKRFYYPLGFSAGGLYAAERSRLQSFVSSHKPNPDEATAEFKFNTFWDDKSVAGRNSASQGNATRRLTYLSTLFKPIPFKEQLTRSLNPNGTPFDRDYVNVTLVKGSVNPPNPPVDCNTVYKSIDKAIKAQACRLDISNGNLTAVPAGLTDIVNLRYLDIRNNYLDAQDSIRLRQLLPKCEIRYTPQKQSLKANWELLQRIEIVNYVPTGQYENFLNNLYQQLKSQQNARIKLVTYYESPVDRKTAEYNAEYLKQYFQKAGGLAASRIDTETQPQSRLENQQQQNQKQNISSKVDYVDIYAMNLKQASSKD